MDTPTQNPDSPEDLNETRAVAQATPPAAIVLLADIPNFAARAKAGADAAARLASLLQQIVGESVYLYDGKVIDPFGQRVIALMPDATKAIQAVLKAKGDLRDYNKAHPGQEHLIDARIVVHGGDAREEGNSIAGPAADTAFAALAAVRPLDAAVSETVVKAQEKLLKTRPLGTFGGEAFVDLLGYERVVAPAPSAETVGVAGATRPARPAAPAKPGEAPEAVAAPKSRLPMLAIGGAAAALLVIAGVVAFMFLRHGEEKPAAAVVSAPVPKLDPNLRRKLIVEPFDLESANPDAQSKTAAIRYATIASLRAIPQVEVVEEGAQSDGRITAVVRDGAVGPELVPTLHIAGGKYEGTPVLLSNAQIATTDVLRWALQTLSVSGGKFEAANQPAFDHFVEALIATNGRPSGDENPKAVAAMTLALQEDPTFLPAQLYAFEFYKAAGNFEAARASARRVAELEPNHAGIVRALADLEFRTGNPAGGVAATRALLAKFPDDKDGLLAIARNAISVGDKETFAKAAARLASAGVTPPPVHDADLTIAAGRIDAAIGRYYDIEIEQPQNPALALKIGRIAVLRRSVEIAELELAKLEKLDPDYGYPLLKAYIEAQNGKAAEANALLAQAIRNARWMDDPYTAAAEIHAILGENAQVLESLARAVGASEPTLNYIVANPLFSYIASEPAFVELKGRIDAARAEVQAELRKVPL